MDGIGKELERTIPDSRWLVLDERERAARFPFGSFHSVGNVPIGNSVLTSAHRPKVVFLSV